MNILEIEKLFQNENTLDLVLKHCEADFERIDYYANQLKNNLVENPESIKKALDELVGVYLSLKPVLAIAETEKTNREEREYNRLRIETENAGNKFVSASAEKQSSAFVSSYRRIRNIIESYTDSVLRASSVLQSILKYLSEEYKLSNE